MIEITGREQKFKQEIFKEFQRKIGKQFPEDYIKFLQKYNGAEFEECVMDIKYNGIRIVGIQGIFGVGLDEYSDLVKVYQQVGEYLPQGYVAIAEESGGDMFCINLNSKGYGNVHYWMHEENEPHDELLKIAETFTEFLHLMEKDTNNEEIDVSGAEIKHIDYDFYMEHKHLYDEDFYEKNKHLITKGGYKG